MGECKLSRGKETKLKGKAKKYPVAGAKSAYQCYDLVRASKWGLAMGAEWVADECFAISATDPEVTPTMKLVSSSDKNSFVCEFQGMQMLFLFS